MNVTVKGKTYVLEDLIITGNKKDDLECDIIHYADEKIATIYTSSNTWFTKIKKMMIANPSGWKIVTLVFRENGSLSGVKVECPKNAISLRSGNSREVSEENRAAASQRLKAARNKK